MKIRHGFVSNSSSSSFLVIFPRIPKSVEDMKKMLFGDKGSVSSYDVSASTYEVAERVFKDMGNPLNNLQIRDVLSSGSTDDGPEYSDFHGNYEAYKIARDSFNELRTKAYIDEHRGKKVFHFHYSDNGGDFESLLEHGDIFSAVEHLQISHH